MMTVSLRAQPVRIPLAKQPSSVRGGLGAVLLATLSQANTPIQSPPTTLNAEAAMSTAAAAEPSSASTGSVPRYQHILLIISENKSYDLIIGPRSRAPHINQLAQQYGNASRFYAEVHPSEANYVAMLGGSTFGIHDDDAYYCRPNLKDPWCSKAAHPGYADHTVTARSLVDQLDERGLTWKAYMESIPEPGSQVVRWPTAAHPVPGVPAELYAVKHNGFMNFKRVQSDPKRRDKIVGFEQLHRDLASGRLPNYAHLVPNQCNDMHGRSGAEVPPDCDKANVDQLIARGDRVVGALVEEIMRSPVWVAEGNVAIVLTFDENDKSERGGPEQGCCSYEPTSAANFGGGRIPTIVITNHGPRRVEDARPYNHYSLLRTTEDAFGIHEYLGLAAETGKGVLSMAPLFAVNR